MAAMEQHIRLAQRLPPRLLNFFKKHPPRQVSADLTSHQPDSASPSTTRITITENTSSSDPNAAAATATAPLEPIDPSGEAAATSKKNHNPFLPFKNPRTGNWHGPAYSLRRQADLFKLAASHNVLPLMPLSPKHPEVREQKRIENGLRVQGTGVGKKVKGKYWERTMRQRLEERRKAMEGMPEMIRRWQQLGHGRGWKKYPK